MNSLNPEKNHHVHLSFQRLALKSRLNIRRLIQKGKAGLIIFQIQKLGTKKTGSILQNNPISSKVAQKNSTFKVS